MAATGGIHVAVMDDGLPTSGGLEALRRIRRLGLAVPCLLVCDHADQRLLSQALDLGAYSVVQANAGGASLAPLVLKAVRRTYRLSWDAGHRPN